MQIFLVVEGVLIILTIIEVVITILGLVDGGAVGIIWGLLFSKSNSSLKKTSFRQILWLSMLQLFGSTFGSSSSRSTRS